jgi:hypothetical protein
MKSAPLEPFNLSNEPAAVAILLTEKATGDRI